MALKEIKNRNIYLTIQDWPQAPVTTSDKAPQVDEEQKADTQDDFFGFSLDTLELAKQILQELKLEKQRVTPN